MPTNTVSIGGDGRLSINVTQVSQDEANNRSTVRVRAIIYNDNSTPTSSGSVSVTLSGTNSYSGSISINVSGNSAQEILDRQYTVTHDANGNRTVSYTVSLGNTGTYTFGSGGSVTQSLTLTRIALEPGAPTSLSRSFSAPNKITLSWGAASSNGSSILEYQIQYSRLSNFSGSVLQSAGTKRTDVVVVSVLGDRYYFRVRARNSRGWGPYSASTYYDVPNTPGIPTKPELAYTPATTMAVAWSATTTGGAAINSYEVQYSDDENFISFKTASSPSTSLVVNDLTVGKVWYFRVRAKNSQGASGWSATASYLVVCGPKVYHNGAWRDTIAYVYHNGAWRTAIPYVNHNGTWKVAGG